MPPVQMVDVDSAAITQIVDSSSAQLVAEFSEKRAKVRLAPVLASLLMAAIIGAFAAEQTVVLVALLVLAPVLIVVAAIRDWSAKTIVLMYDLEPEYAALYKELHDAFLGLRGASKLWHVGSKGKVHDTKYHAGANELIRRSQVSVSFRNPPSVKTNLPTPSIAVGKQRLYFFPDCLLVFENRRVGAVSYENLKVKVDEIRFIETSGVPHDTKIVDRTWEYVNKKGGPDRRFKENRQLPIVQYQSLHFRSSSGLNELLHASCVGLAPAIRDSIAKVGVTLPNEVAPPALDAPTEEPEDDVPQLLTCPSCEGGIPLAQIEEGQNICPFCRDSFKVAFE